MAESPMETTRDVRQTVHWQVVGSFVLFLLVLAFPLYKATEGSRREDALRAQDQALVAGGQHLFGLNCSTCHGENGTGGSGPALNSQQFLTSATDAQIRGIIAGGVPGTEMPAWLNEFGGPLTDQEILEITAYLRSLEKTAPSVPDWRTPEGTG